MSAFFKVLATFPGFQLPLWVIKGSYFPGVGFDITFLHGGFEDLFKLFFLPVCCPLHFSEIREENLLWKAYIKHPNNMPNSTKLMVDKYGLNTGYVGFCEKAAVGTFVFPLDSQDFSQVALMGLL